MKSKLKVVLLCFGVFAGLLILVVLGGVILLSAMINLENTGEVGTAVYAVKDTPSNMYFIKAGDKYIAVDAGNNIKNIQKQMEILKIDNRTIIAVFLTHTDSDHTAGLGLFTHAAIYISREEEQLINGKSNRFLFFNNKLEYDYTLMDDNQSIIIEEIEVKGILTPGHTPGSMCYLVNSHYLFTGDTIGIEKGKAKPYLSFAPPIHKQSIKKLTALPGIEAVFTGHSGVSNDCDTIFEEWRE